MIYLTMKHSGRNPQFTEITDPDFRYTVSANPYARFLEKLPRRPDGKTYVHLDQEAESKRGLWGAQFALSAERAQPIHLEIGCNAGHWILAQAAKDPTAHYLGIDWKFKAIHRAAEKAHAKDLQNLMFIRGHAGRVRFLFSPGELNSVRVFFPDPWLKRAQRKNRLLSSLFFAHLHEVVTPGGFLEFRTDQREYFDDVLKMMEPGLSRLWRITERTHDRHHGVDKSVFLKTVAPPEVTLFEKLFIKDGVPICMLRAERLPSNL